MPAVFSRPLAGITAALVLACFVLLPPAPARAQVDLDAARSLVAEVAEQGVSDVLVSDLSHGEKIERFRALFEQHFDIPAIARFVLARHARGLDEAELARFIDLFREVNIYTWARRFKDYDGQQLVVSDALADGDHGAFVDTRVEQEGNQQPMTVRWRLRQREDGFKVVDLIVEGVSMAITYRSEYGSVISQRGSVAALNALLEQQVERLKAEQPS